MRLHARPRVAQTLLARAPAAQAFPGLALLAQVPVARILLAQILVVLRLTPVAVVAGALPPQAVLGQASPTGILAKAPPTGVAAHSPPTESLAFPGGPSDRFGFRAPDSLPDAGYRQSEAQRLPVPALGYLLRYGGEDRPSIDVYVYPVVPDGEPLPEGEGWTARLEEEFRRGMAEVRLFADRAGRTLALEGEARYIPAEAAADWGAAAGVPGGAAAGASAGELALRHQPMGWEDAEGLTVATHLALGATGRAFVKMRGTWTRAPTSPNDLDAHFEAFAAAFAVAFRTSAAPGMEGFDPVAARLLPLPDDIPEAFDYRLPSRLRSGWQLQGTRALDEGAGATALFATQAWPIPVQAFIRPFESGPDALEARWEEERAAWARQFQEGLAEQGFAPVTEAPEILPLLEAGTLYGPVPAYRARWPFRHDDGRELEALFAVTAIEEVLLVLARMAPPLAGVDGTAFFTAFVEELLANVLATRRPPSDGGE